MSVRMLRALILPVAGVALILGVGGAIVIQRSVETVNDRILGAASRAIADSLSVERGQIALNLSPAIFGMLEDNERDNVYYSVRHRGQVITGYGDLPDVAPGGLRDLEVILTYARFHNRDIRVVAEGRRLPGIAEPLTVEVAETMDARRRTISTMLEGLIVLEGVLIGLTAILLPLAVRWGLRPLSKLGDDMNTRAGSDLTPLSDAKVPSELLYLVRAFNGLLNRLDATLQGMRRFTADASHQMRTPLSILRTHVALLKKAAPGSSEASESLEDIDQATIRLQQLLVQLLALAKADHAATTKPKLEAVDLNEVTESVASEYAPGAVRSRVDLHFERLASEATAMTHPVLVAELLGNLVDNAIRYNRKNGSVAISIVSSKKGPQVVIEDDGPGIAVDQREEVFTRFARLDRDHTRGGSGLGLSIARMLAEAIGAEIALETPASGIGLRVQIQFARA